MTGTGERAPIPDTLRAEACRRLARVVLHGVQSADRALLEGLPGLEAALGGDSDEAAAEHFRVISTEAPPYASVFLESTGLPGGALSMEIERLRVSSGLGATHSEAADHLGHELELLAAMVEDSGVGGAAGAFVDNHLLEWVPAWVVTVRRVNSPLWAAIGEVLLEALIDHRAAAGGSAHATDSVPPASPDQSASLTVPASCGAYLTPFEIRTIGRALELPTGFGGRARLLETLTDSAAFHGVSGRMRSALADAFTVRMEEFEGLVETMGLAHGRTGSWIERLAASVDRLRRDIP